MSQNKQIYYYDTGAFWRFFTIEYIEKIKLKDELKLYSPLNTDVNISRMISPWAVEEFFHAYITMQGKNIKLPKGIEYPEKFFEKEIKKRTEVLSKIKSFLFLFSQDDVETRVINQLFLSLIFSAKENDILSLSKNDSKIHSKDLLHLAYALYFRTNTFITCDKGFTLLLNVDIIKRLLSQYKLKEIIIFDENLTKIKKIIVV